MRELESIIYIDVKPPKPDGGNVPVQLSEQTMQERYTKVLHRMEQEDYDTLIIYADLEHGSNFEYLTGFLPRFEEALLIINKDGDNYMLMGNENLNKVEHARIKAKAIHVPIFSLPNQPMDTSFTIMDLLQQAEVTDNKRVGIVGWKNFTDKQEDNQKLFDIPYFIIDGVKQLIGKHGELVNATYIFIGEKGIRCRNSVNELEHYEFGASLASDCMLHALSELDIDKSEMELGDFLNSYGQRNSVVTIAAAGKRFVNANLYPTEKVITLGDPISLTVGYKGGLSSRGGYAVSNEDQLPVGQQDYIEVVVKPYMLAVVTWLEQVHCGMAGEQVYRLIEQILPKSIYHWSLCPGHLVADEEWMSSPIYEGSKEELDSGMLFQIDIIPHMKGYGGTNAETTVALADEQLRTKIQEKAPKLWKRIIQRREYIEQQLHISIHPDILPMCSTVGYLCPLMLAKDKAIRVK